MNQDFCSQFIHGIKKILGKHLFFMYETISIETIAIPSLTGLDSNIYLATIKSILFSFQNPENTFQFIRDICDLRDIGEQYA